MSRIESRIQELGFQLPPLSKPVAAYIPAVRAGDLAMTSGQLPLVDGALKMTGSVGEGGLTVEEAAPLARIAVLNGLAAIKDVIGSLDQITRIVRIVVFVQSMDGFHDQPKVANGASVFLQEVFGEAGKHIRSAVGTNALPLNAPVEVELTVEIAD